MFGANLIDDTGKSMGTYDGYVPKWFPAPSVRHLGDYVELLIDLETGKIVNWQKPTKQNLADFKLETNS